MEHLLDGDVPFTPPGRARLGERKLPELCTAK